MKEDRRKVVDDEIAFRCCRCGRGYEEGESEEIIASHGTSGTGLGTRVLCEECALLPTNAAHE